MDLTPEFAQHVIDSASKYKECTLEVDRLTSLLQEAVKLLETMTIYYL